MTTRTALIAITVAVITAAAAAALPLRLHIFTAIATGAIVAIGLRLRAVPVTVVGLLAMLLAVATGPATQAGVPGLLICVVPAWAVSLIAAAELDGHRPPPKDRRTRGVAVRGEVVACAASVPLLALAMGPPSVPPTWATAALLSLISLVAVALAVLRRRRPA